MWNQFEANKEILKKQYEEHNWKNGLEVDELNKNVAKIMEDNLGISCTKAKGESVAYILRNAQIDICPEEFFADKINHGEIMMSYFWKFQDRCRTKFCPDAGKTYAEALEIRAYEATMDFGHIAPDWNFVIGNGIVGIIERLKEHRQKHLDDAEKVSFYDNCLMVYEAFTDLLLRFAALAEEHDTEKMKFVAENFRVLSTSAPKTLAQAMQLTLLFYVVQTKLDCTIVRSLGGLDRLYYPFYQADIASARFTEAQLRELTSDFLWKISAMGVSNNLPFYICGKDAYGQDATNAYTYVILEEYRKLDIYDPKMHVLYHSGMDMEVLDLVLEMIREGKNSFVFMNTDVISTSLEKIGISPEDAKKVTVYGCYEAAAEGTEIAATCAGMLNMAKAVEFALNDGADMKSGKQFGPQTGKDFESFDAFYEAVKTQLVFITESCMDTISEYEKHYEEVSPSPIISSTFENSVVSGKNAMAGGAKYNNTSIVGVGIATLTDSIMAIKKAVFEDKKLSCQEFVDCLKQNWENYDDLRNYCHNLNAKYGNNKTETDQVASELLDLFADKINNTPNSRGGVFRCGLFSVDWRFRLGEGTAATPDGRMEGEPLSKNSAAVIGQDKNGVTAFINSMLKLDATKIPDGYVADVVLHESAVDGDDGMASFKGLLLAFMNGGGFSIHFNVLNPDVLLKAQAEPDKYRNLQIRLCGWNVYFVNLTKREQDEFILQSRNRS